MGCTSSKAQVDPAVHQGNASPPQPQQTPRGDATLIISDDGNPNASPHKTEREQLSPDEIAERQQIEAALAETVERLKQEQERNAAAVAALSSKPNKPDVSPNGSPYRSGSISKHQLAPLKHHGSHRRLAGENSDGGSSSVEQRPSSVQSRRGMRDQTAANADGEVVASGSRIRPVTPKTSRHGNSTSRSTRKHHHSSHELVDESGKTAEDEEGGDGDSSHWRRVRMELNPLLFAHLPTDLRPKVKPMPWVERQVYSIYDDFMQSERYLSTLRPTTPYVVGAAPEESRGGRGFSLTKGKSPSNSSGALNVSARELQTINSLDNLEASQGASTLSASLQAPSRMTISDPLNSSGGEGSGQHMNMLRQEIYSRFVKRAGEDVETGERKLLSFVRSVYKYGRKGSLRCLLFGRALGIFEPMRDSEFRFIFAIYVDVSPMIDGQSDTPLRLKERRALSAVLKACELNRSSHQYNPLEVAVGRIIDVSPDSCITVDELMQTCALQLQS